jgi:hypothetical protein
MPIRLDDEATLAKLAAITVAEEVCTPDGWVLGRFIPAGADKMSFPEFGVTDAELMRALTNPNTKWRTPEEVEARLRELRKCSDVTQVSDTLERSSLVPACP